MEEVQRGGSRRSQSYKRRLLSYVLCFVLVLGLIQPSPAKAVVVEGAVAATAGVVAAPALSVLCTLILTAVGVDFVSGVFGGSDVFGSQAYEVGAALGAAGMAVGGSISSWLQEQVDAITAAGGFTVGDSFSVPSDVAEFARQWALQNYDISVTEISSDGFLSSDGTLIPFTTLQSYPNKYASGYYPVATLGSVFLPGSTIYYNSVSCLHNARGSGR